MQIIMEKAQINKGKIALYILNFILSCLIIRFYNIPLFFTIPLSFVFSASAFFAVKRGIERRELKGNLIFSACISASVVIGRHVNLSGGGINRFNICDLIIFSALTLMHLYFSFVASRLYGCMIRKEGKINLNWFHYTLLWFSIFGTWVFCLGINFPGNISYDSIANIQMATGKVNLTNHHPIVYTLAIRMFFGIGKVFGVSVNCIVAAFLAVQAAMMALIVTHMIGWLYKRTSNMLFLFGITGFFIMNPVFSFYAVHMWKDIPFSYCLIEYILCIYEITENGGENLGNIKFQIRYLIFMILVCFFRNNGIYIVLLSSAVLFIVYKKSVRNTMLIIGATILIQGPIYSILGIEHSEFVESIGRPLQQVSYTIRVGGQLEEEQKKFLENIMPLSEWGGGYMILSVQILLNGRRDLIMSF